MITPEIKQQLKKAIEGKQHISFLVGAGLSSESGIPTFRDKDGYWMPGSENYTPQEMATWRMFNLQSHKIWNWYLNRFHICFQAKPNAGHFALKNLQDLFPERFALITQNVDGLHFQTGMNAKQIYSIHGDLRFMRCAESCNKKLTPLPDALKSRGLQEALSEEEIKLLQCPHCGGIYRPHVLWFDEIYNEEYYKLDTVCYTALTTDLLFIIGTSGATNLPSQVFLMALSNDTTVIDINPNSSLFTEEILENPNAYWIKGKSGEILPQIVEEMRQLKTEIG